jgi:hypothetical protein
VTNDFCINSHDNGISLELSPLSGIFITDAVPFDPSSSFETQSAWHGTRVSITDIQPKSTKVVLKGFATTESALRTIAKYHITNYNWNSDPDKLYLVVDLTKRWKIYALDFNYTHDRPGMPFPFTITLTLSEIGAEGYVLTSKTGSSSSSPIAVTSIVNAGDQITLFDSIKITGTYSGASNLISPIITQESLGYFIGVADVLLDSAYFEFYNNYTARHTYIDAFFDTNKFSRNKNASTNVTFSTDHLIVAASGVLQYKFQLTHPLLQDPVLTLTINTVIGSPVLEVSPNGSNWWECEKSLTAGNLIDYNLTKLAGYSDFYFRITTNTSASLNLSYMKLVSWHNYSGQKPIPCLRAGETEQLNISFSAGTLDYEVNYRDKWSA